MRKETIVVLLAATISLAGCEFNRAADANRAKTEMVGLTKLAVLACMGSPAQRQADGRVEVWSYPPGGNSTSFRTGNAAFGQWAFGTSFTHTQRRYCIVNITVQDGVVQRLNYVGRTGGLLTKGEQCGFAVEACVE